MPIFLSLSRANAQRLQDLPGGYEARVNFLATALGLQMVGRAGLTNSQKALVKVSMPPPVHYHLVDFCHFLTLSGGKGFYGIGRIRLACLQAKHPLAVASAIGCYD